jgi:hypothetical protein
MILLSPMAAPMSSTRSTGLARISGSNELIALRGERASIGNADWHCLKVENLNAVG